MIQTQEGWYWHKPIDGARWECAPVYLILDMDGSGHRTLRNGHCPWPPLEQGEWGPRIPEPERLMAMEELVAYGYETGNQEEVYFLCHYCDGREAGGVMQHAADCPWLRSQPKGESK